MLGLRGSSRGLRAIPAVVLACAAVVTLVCAGPRFSGKSQRGGPPEVRGEAAPPAANPERGPSEASRAARTPLAPGAFRYTQLDIGQGDAALLENGPGPAALIDLGPSGGAPALLAAVNRVHARLAWVLVSHGHADHYGGLHAIFAGASPAALVVPRAPEEGVEWARTLAWARARGVKVVDTERGAALELGAGLGLDVLAPRAPMVRSRSDVNANGLVVRVSHTVADRTHRFLLTGDAELPTEARLLDHPDELRADVLKAAHHGSGFSSSLRFLEAVAPQVVLVSAGAGNDYGHPHRGALERFLDVGARVLRTDLHGSIAVTSTASGLLVEAEREVPPGEENVGPGGDGDALPRRHRPRRPRHR